MVGPNPSPSIAVSRPAGNAGKAVVKVVSQPTAVVPEVGQGQPATDPAVRSKTIKISIDKEHFWAYEEATSWSIKDQSQPRLAQLYLSVRWETRLTTMSATGMYTVRRLCIAVGLMTAICATAYSTVMVMLSTLANSGILASSGRELLTAASGCIRIWPRSSLLGQTSAQG